MYRPMDTEAIALMSEIEVFLTMIETSTNQTHLKQLRSDIYKRWRFFNDCVSIFEFSPGVWDQLDDKMGRLI